jgi:RNA polymerase sigma-70 factor (ECF subfamily)
MAVDELISRVMEEGQRSWGFVIPESILVAHLERVGVDRETISNYGVDFYLASACAAGLHPALLVLEKEFLSRVPQYVGRVCRDPATVEEIRQDLRVRMLVGPPPRIGTYAGAGPLGAFLCVAALRIALDRARREGRAPLSIDAEALTNAHQRTMDPDFEVLSGQHRQAVQEALDQALVELPVRDQAVLRFYFVEELNIEAIGAIYGVNRSSVARWLADIRSRLLNVVKERVGPVLGLTPSELRSLLREVRSGLRASVSRLWRKD